MWKMKNWKKYGVIFSLGIIVCWVGSCSNGQDLSKKKEGVITLPDARLPGPLYEKIYGKISYDWSLVDIYGNTVYFEEFRGHPLLINVWATWCKPCIVEMPTLQNLYETLRDEGITVLTISREEDIIVRNFFKKNGYTLPTYLVRDDFPQVFTTHSIPATFIINPSGEIVYRHIGAANWNTESCRRFLRSLL